MKAIILAAGCGRRLFGDDSQSPKCLIPIGSATLIERGITNLRAAGLRDITIVVGPGADKVRSLCGPDVSYIVNPRYADTDSLYSLWLARDVLQAGFIVLNGDVLFHPLLLQKLLASPEEDALLVDGSRPEQFGSEEMKVKICDGRIHLIAKHLHAAESHGESVGIAKFSRRGAALLVDILDRCVAAGEVMYPVPHALQMFVQERPLSVVSTAGLPWIEIDFPEDYKHALDSVLPRIELLRECEP